jgi:trigger factor
MAASSELIRSVEVEVPAGEVERETLRIAQGLQRRARIPGFRPGKAPLSLVRQHFEAKIREETLETLIPAHLRAAFERENLEPVSQPRLGPLDYQPGAALKFSASFEIMPAFELGDYRALRISTAPVTVTAADIDAELERLRERHSRHEPAEADTAADGLIAVAEARTLSAESAAAEASSKEEAPQEVAIEVGAPDTLPAFSEALRGMKAGEERELDVTYPADYPAKSLAGQARRYQVRLLRLEKKVLPELNDAFAKSATGVETVAELRQRIEAALRAEREHEARHAAEEQLVDQLLEQNPFPVPQTLVERRIEARIESNLRGLAEQGVDLRRLKPDWAMLRQRHQPPAERDVRAALVLEKIAERENIAAPEAAVEEEIATAAQDLKQTPEALRARLADNGGLERIRNRMRQDQVMRFLLDLAGGAGAASGAGTKETK